MNHTDHVNLIRPGIPTPGGVWADLGAGAGAFTLALAELIGPAGQIYAVDKNRGALKRLEKAVRAHQPALTLQTIAADFGQPLPLPALDGLIMANSLHFVRHKEPVLRLLRRYLRPGGRLILVEYGTDRGNYWVPYPFSYPSWEALAARAGFVETSLLAKRPSRFLGQIYSALSLAPTLERRD